MIISLGVLGTYFYYKVSTLISLINMEVGINVEGGILWKKLMHDSNGVECGKNIRNQ
jgi:hypothetical protein